MKPRSAKDVMLCWNPGGAVALVPWPDDEQRVSDAFECSSLACCDWVQSADAEKRKAACFIEAMHLIVRDGCDPQAVHRALLGVVEYRDGLAADMLADPRS